MSTLLIPEPPLQVLPTLAARIGLNEALLLQQIHYWTTRKEADENGEFWVWKTVADWEREFPFWSGSTIKRTVAKLKKEGYLAVRQVGLDRVNHYRVLYDAIPHEVNLIPSEVNLTPSSDQSDPVSTHTETTNREQPTSSSSLNDVEAQTPVVIRHVFDHWSGLYSPRAAFDDKRAKRIRARLKERMSTGSTLDEAGRDLCRAVTNARRDDWLAGRAAKSPGYLNKLDTLLRDAAQVERLLALTESGPVPDDDFDPDEEHLRDLRALHGDDYVPPGSDDEPAPA